jgi:HK97 family phage major capsid protein
MKFDEMTVEELEARQAEIAGMSTEEATTEEIDARAAELEAIRDELQARANAAAKAEAERQAVAEGAGETKEEVREEKRMENLEMRNTPEYVNAFADYIKTGNDHECRTLLTETVSGTVPVPAFVEDIVKTAWEKNELLSRISKTNFRGNLKVPFEKAADGAYVHTEGTTGLTEENLEIGIVTLTPNNIKKWIRISDEVVAMGGESFVRYIYEEITYRILNKLVSELVAKVVAAEVTNGATSIGVPVLKQAPGVMTIADATSKLSEDARDLCIVINRLSEQSFNAAFAQANFAIDPYAGLPRIYTSALGAYSTLSENGVYGFVGDLSALQANYPEGEGIVIKWDDLSEAEDDLVKIVGRQYVGYGITAPGKLVKLTKPGA